MLYDWLSLFSKQWWLFLYAGCHRTILLVKLIFAHRLVKRFGLWVIIDGINKQECFVVQKSTARFKILNCRDFGAAEVHGIGRNKKVFYYSALTFIIEQFGCLTRTWEVDLWSQVHWDKSYIQSRSSCPWSSWSLSDSNRDLAPWQVPSRIPSDRLFAQR